MPLPPRWALGYHQSRYSYYPADVVRRVAREFRERRLPADAIYLDIDYMDGYRVFTWHPERFADPRALTRDLAEQGFKLVTIIDPGVKYEPEGGYRAYDEGHERGYFIRDKQTGGEWMGFVWPGRCVFPDFVRAEVRRWWGDLHRGLVEDGVRGIWNDMNEPAVHAHANIHEDREFIVPDDDTPQGDCTEPTTHAETHNLYGHLEDRATYDGLRRLRPDERPFVLTRAGFAGVQRWSAVWTGDNSGVWEHLEMSLPQLMNLGLSGVPFVGVDIGGFWGNSTRDLFRPLDAARRVLSVRAEPFGYWRRGQGAVGLG
jgi:alpha-glucosidase